MTSKTRPKLQSRQWSSKGSRYLYVPVPHEDGAGIQKNMMPTRSFPLPSFRRLIEPGTRMPNPKAFREI